MWRTSADFLKTRKDKWLSSTTDNVANIEYTLPHYSQIDTFVNNFETDHPADTDQIRSVWQLFDGSDDCEENCSLDCLMNDKCSYGQLMEFYQQTQSVLCPFHKEENYTEEDFPDPESEFKPELDKLISSFAPFYHNRQEPGSLSCPDLIDRISSRPG